MYRSVTGSKQPETPYNGLAYGLPQDKGNMGESFTMYSRPSAFGPPISTVANAEEPVTIKNWASFKNAQSENFSYAPGTVINSGVTASNPAIGENYEFTPPYYHGEAWADVIFKTTLWCQKIFTS